MTRQEIESNTIALLRTAGGTRPDLRVVEINNRKLVVKDFCRSDTLFRMLIGPILIKRERTALARLSGIGGVPTFIESIDRYAFVMEHIEGVSLGEYAQTHNPEFFDRLKEVLKSIHSRGVAHCDLRSSGNALVTADGSPCVVDFAACVMKSGWWNVLMNLAFREFSKADDYAILILKRKHAPELLTPEELHLLANPMPYERIAKNVGITIRNITRKLLTRKQ